ncbi:hypothetical protein CPLU01_12796 [Colletotrichum plurivorum]|uniref:C2H2-type domain-containing protein n=1 Tax=Colletotrichum plurivorum TaxID=2175906 RepID=A0A8H6JWY9_9PEZI|nr:hypothetical protein CPLU01_12796 [Colletotrichum plurivorum]
MPEPEMRLTGQGNTHQRVHPTSNPRARGRKRGFNSLSQVSHVEPQSSDPTPVGRTRTSLTPPAYIDSYLEYKKALFIEIFMEKVGEWLDDNVCTLEEANEHDGDSTSSSKSSGSRGIKRAASAGKLVPGTKRQNRGDKEDGEDDDGEGGSAPNRTMKRSKTQDNRKRFACPFFKYNQERFKEHRSCCGPGWLEIHRLKEHLYRHHQLFTCMRCFKGFKSKELVDDHMRAEIICKTRDKASYEADPSDGMDQDTVRQLRARRPGKSDAHDRQSDHEKWYEVYQILFPEENVNNLPSPYYDTEKNEVSDDMKRQYVRFLRRQVPDMIRKELEAEVSKCFTDINATMLSQLATWINNSAAQCAKIFEYIPSPSQAAAQVDPETSRVNSRAASPEVPTVFQSAEPIDPWPCAFPLPEDFNLDLYPTFEDPSSLDCLPMPDSTYGSASAGGSADLQWGF